MRETRNNIQTFFKGINRSVVAALVLAFGFTACVQSDYNPLAGMSNASIGSTIVSSNATTISGSTSGDTSLLWVLQVVEGRDFCSLPKLSGRVGEDFTILVGQNRSGVERNAKVRITFTDGYTKDFSIHQLAETENMEYDRPWAEQPEYRDGQSFVHKTYYTTLSDGQRVRNFSICYDTDKLVSHWVAYPIHQSYLGSLSRTNEWSFDDAYYKASGSSYTRSYIPTNPVIPQTQQQNIEAGGYQASGWDRGHMMPSASRLNAYELNAQTFYATNMMPQQSQFNQKIWATLEDDVRGWRCSDTLFVVTGTLYEGTPKTLTARGRTIAVPSHAYKLVLRTKNGNTKKHIASIKSADDIKCIGFLFENNATGAATTIKDAAVSVAEIERRSGFKFFRNLNAEIADEVKSQKNLSDWGL